MGDIEFRKAIPTDAEQLVKLYSDVYGGGYSRAEYSDPKLLESLLLSGKYICYVALSGEEMVGSSAIVLHEWNRSFEFGRTAVREDYLNKKIAKSVCGLARDDVMSDGFELGWGTVRNDPIYRISLNDGMTMVGYTSQYKPHHTRETQLVCEMGIPKKRIVPENHIYELDIVKSIEKSTMMPGQKGDYPETVAINTGKRGKSSIFFEYNPEDSSAKITDLPDILPEHFLVTLLADKIEEMSYLRRFGFNVTAFLPAWYYLDGMRYDCILMENSDSPPSSSDSVIDMLIKGFISGFEKINQGF
jgi:hypothetical protein